MRAQVASLKLLKPKSCHYASFGAIGDEEVVIMITLGFQSVEKESSTRVDVLGMPLHWTNFWDAIVTCLPVIINQLYSSAFLYSSTFKDRAIDWPHANSPGRVCWPSTPDISDIMIFIFQNGLLSVQYTQNSSTEPVTRNLKENKNVKIIKDKNLSPNFVTTHIVAHSCKQHVHVHHLYTFFFEGELMEWIHCCSYYANTSMR